MSILGVIGDVHGNLSRLHDVLELLVNRERVHGILLVGDIGANLLYGPESANAPRDLARYDRSIELVLEAVQQTGLPYAYVPGNHDLPTLAAPGNCDGKVVDVAGFKVYGVGGSTSIFGFPYERTDEQLRKSCVDTPPAAFDVLLAHDPPARTQLGVCRKGPPAGSEVVRELCGRAVAMACGHIHESGGVERIGDCLALNAGALGEPYGRVQYGLIDADHSVEWHAYGPEQQQVLLRWA